MLLGPLLVRFMAQALLDEKPMNKWKAYALDFL
ncbi:Hypothetical protein Minf_1139 [Methylacidiphilum infernorum V4]|uniref:Uncharacterized protein n=1 Tax=Methylacidiphilum infernorum (isolate V4) TaxID=481448 RepID=B3DV41_METI4|nr:Hypothetical protein Minf_1139 [Methylacidiphilum infernorum V4]